MNSATQWRLRSMVTAALMLFLGILPPPLLSADGPTVTGAIPPIPRILPPPGIEIPAERLTHLSTRLAELSQQLAEVTVKNRADVTVLLKAVTYAITNGEFFDARDVKVAEQLLDEADRRLNELQTSKAVSSWTATSVTVRGFHSTIDGSVQPYGIVIPENLLQSSSGAAVPIYVWLHGRGDKMTDLQFIGQRLNKPTEFAPTNGIVVHPFGRYCNAFKFAGETDVFECVRAVIDQYPRYFNSSSGSTPPVVLIGFSMGGAGAWHLGAHHPGVWRAVSPGAGFAETARYQNLSPDKFPPWYEQRLWGLYDAPGYVRNLFNIPVVAYSGELDKQIQAARVMEEAFAREGEKLTHLIGPGMGHKYHPDVLKQLTRTLEQYSGEDPWLKLGSLRLQTRSLRYASIDTSGVFNPDQRPSARQNANQLLAIQQVEQSWNDTRIDVVGMKNKPSFPFVHRPAVNTPARIDFSAIDRIETKNVRRFSISVVGIPPNAPFSIDDQDVSVKDAASRETGFVKTFAKKAGRWHEWPNPEVFFPVDEGILQKTPFLQGPIDDAFYDPFLVVVPSGESKHPAVERWVRFELAHFKDRWRRLFRGDVRIKKDNELTKEDYERYHLIAWGDADSNALIKAVADKLPIKWNPDKITVGDQSYDSAGHVPVMIYPNPHANSGGQRYIVLNSGPTFREGHDTSNSLQTPKLPDWAVVDLSVLPDGKAPGRIADAGFFDEQWQLKPSPQK